jgi:hypothetical protein
MAQRSPIIACEDVPLDEARRTSRGSGMDLELYHALKQRIHALDKAATRLTISESTNPTTMKNRILRVGTELSIPVTVRKVPGGLLFWRSTNEDLQQAKAVVQRLHVARKPPRTTHRGRRRRG